MDVHYLQPQTPNGPSRREFYPTSPLGHYLRLLIAIILTILHITPVIITNPNNPNAILFAQPYITKWAMVPYAAYYIATSVSSLIRAKYSYILTCLDLTSTRSEILLITEPHTIIRNLRVAQLGYLLSGGVLMWDLPYLWATYLVPALWNSLPLYKFGEWKVELSYVMVAALLVLTLMVGLALVAALVGDPGWRLMKKARKVEGLCWERLEREERARGGQKESWLGPRGWWPRCDDFMGDKATTSS